MGRPPEDLPARRAAGEPAPGAIDVGGDLEPDRPARHEARGAVALDAAPEKPIFAYAEAALREDLADLGAQVLALDQDVVAGVAPQDQPAVAGQDGAAFAAGQLDEAPVLDAGGVEDVVPQDDEPLGEGTEHAVGREFQEGAPLV